MKLTCSKAGVRAVRALSLVHVAALITVLPIAAADAGTPVVQLRPTVIAQLPHDDTAFTEGLSLDGASLFESTGLEGQSQLRELDPTTGQLRRSATLPPSYFGEGIAAVGDRIWQLTYRNGVAIEWDRATLSRRREVPLTGEGWGLCLAGDHLVRSDGTAHLHLHDPGDMHETGMITATLNGTELSGLNGLDCVGNQIWANVFPTNRIVRIDAPTGAVTGVVDVEGLLDPKLADNIHILNGITHVDDTQFLITGKDWPNMYRVTFDPV
ncbi:MAG: glutaminyl-peptide cyclotransferase [Mycobacterium sp.]